MLRRCHIDGCKTTDNQERLSQTGEGSTSLLWCRKHLREPHCSKDGCRVRDRKELKLVDEAPDDQDPEDEPELDEYRCRDHPPSDTDGEEEEEEENVDSDEAEEVRNDRH